MQNIIIDPDGQLCLIDFAESVHAPAYYDKPFMHDFTALAQDRVLMEAYYDDCGTEAFLNMITMSVLLNWFSGISLQYLADKTGMKVSAIISISALRDMLSKFLKR